MGNVLFGGPEIKAPKPKTAIRPANRRINQANKAAKTLSPVGFNAGGLSAKFNKSGVTVGSSPQRQGLVNTLAQRFEDHASKVAELRARVAPGASELRRVRLEQIENARMASVSNLRDNLARRRVLGSSFGEDAIARTDREFGQAAEMTAAEVEFQELELTNQFLTEEFDLRRQSVATQIGELNIQADLAAGLTAEANATLRMGAQLQAQLAAADADFRASIFGTQSQTAINQADLDARAQEGVGNLVGKVAGVALAPATGGASLALTGTSLGLR